MTNTVTNTSRCCLRFNHKCDYGWVVVFASFLALFAMYGVQYTYGIFQQQYQDIYRGRATTTSLSFIGSVSFASLGLFGVFTGRLGDRLGYRITMLIGTLLMCLGLLLASWATEVWHLYLTQGLMFGLGTSFAFYPVLAAPARWFDKRRGFATGIAVSGSGLGGMAMAPVIRKLIDAIGVAWTLRCLAAGVLVVMFIAIACIRLPPPDSDSTITSSPISTKEKVEADNVSTSPTSTNGTNPNTNNDTLITHESNEKTEKSDHIIQVNESTPPDNIPSVGSRQWLWERVKNPAFLGLWITNIFCSSGYLVPFYYIPAYATSIGLSKTDGATLIGIMNGASALGRISLGLASDYIGRINTYVSSVMAAGIVCLAIWLPSTGMAPLVIFSLLYGLFMGGFVTLTPVVITVVFGMDGIATTIGMIYASTGVSNLIGPPIAGAILDATKDNSGYMPLILYAGIMIVSGASMAIVLVRQRLSRHWLVKI